MKTVLRAAAIGAALAAASAGMSAVGALPAFADGVTPTTVTVTANHASILSGQSEAFTAVVAPAKVGSIKITGAVNWTVTGHDGSTVACSEVTLLTSGGKSKCKIFKGTLLAGGAPYTATASYAGDGVTFGPSSGSGSVAMTEGSTRVKITLNAVPSGGNLTTVSAEVVDGPATALLTGNVVFTISSQFHSAGVTVACSGPLKGVLNNTQPVATQLDGTQVATCNLPAGWMTLPKSNNQNKVPSDGWSISAVYLGNSSFISSFRTVKGTAKS